MVIRFTTAFRRMYRKLSQDQQSHADRALRLFTENPFNPKLHNHKLAGSQEGMRSIAAGYDLRMIYIEKEGYSLVLFLMVGNHDTVY